MNKKIYAAIVIFLLLSLCGCQSNHHTYDANDTSSKESNDEDKDINIDFIFNETNITNLADIVENFDWDIRKSTHDFEVENQIEEGTVPNEILNVLLSVNDGDDKNDELYQEYLSVHADSLYYEETIGNSELNDSAFFQSIAERGILNTRQIDIDYDGEYEYLIEYAEGTQGYSALSILKNVSGEMKEYIMCLRKTGIMICWR